MKTTLLTALAAAALMAGCSKSDTGTPCVKIAPTIQTRVTGLHFDSGDRIGLNITKGSGNLCPERSDDLRRYGLYGCGVAVV